MQEWTLKLRVIPPPGVGYVVPAPPPITVAENTNHYLCGQCGTLLVIADDDQVHVSSSDAGNADATTKWKRNFHQ